MPNNKECPNCQKSLPVTASNCKYCGASLESEQGSSFFDTHNGPAPAAPRVVAPPKVPGISIAPPAPPAVARPKPPVASAPAPQPPKNDSTDEKTTVMEMPAEYLARMNEPSDATPAVPVAVVTDEPSGTIDLDEIEPVDEPSGTMDLDEIESVDEPSAEISLDEPSTEISLDELDGSSSMPNEPSAHAPGLSGGAPVPAAMAVPRSVDTPTVGDGVPKLSFAQPADRVASQKEIPAPAAHAPAPKKTMLGMPALTMDELEKKGPDEDDDWIPDSESSALIELDDVAGSTPAPAEATFDGPAPAPPRPGAPLPRPTGVPAAMVAEPPVEETARIDPEEIRRKYKSDDDHTPDEVGGLDKLIARFMALPQGQRVVIAGGGAFVVVLLLTIFFMWAFGDSGEEVVVVDADAIQQGDEPSGNDIKTAPPTSSKSEAAAPKAAPVPQSANCAAIKTYGDMLPMIDVARDVVGGVAKSGKLCGLFDASLSSVAGALTGREQVVQVGYDWIADGQKIRVRGAKGAMVEFLFTGQKLYSIRFDYRRGTAGKSVTPEKLQKVLRREKSYKDTLGRQVTRFLDQDLVAELIEEDWNGTTLKTVQVTNLTVEKRMAAGAGEREKVAGLFREGEMAYRAWKFDEALVKYEQISAIDEHIGAPLVKAALIYLRQDNFSKARSLAEKTVKMTRENRVKADALGVLAVVALKDGSSAKALEHLRAARELAPKAKAFANNLAMLETSNYPVKQVAQTAIRLDCIKAGKSNASERGVLARGLFPERAVYDTAYNAVRKKRAFKKIFKQYRQWECP